MSGIALIVFSRAPIPGQTKTRLASEIGNEAACDFHVRCLLDLLDTCSDFRDGYGGAGDGLSNPAVEFHLFITPPGSEKEFRRAGVRWPEDFQIHPQNGAELGGRMANAFESVLKGSPRGMLALLVGCDLPLLTGAHLAQAVKGLAGADVVFGAAEDGGYYLVGLKRPHPELFDLPEWGGPHVLRDSVERARGLGLSTKLIAAMPDADTLAGLEGIRRHPGFTNPPSTRSAHFIQALLERKKPGARG